MSIDESFNELLDTTVIEHDEVHTVEELLKALEGKELNDAVVTKNLFVSFGKKKKKQYFLLVAAHDQETPLKKVGALLGGLKNGRFGDVEKALGVQAGAVSPLAVKNDESKAVTVVLDQSLKDRYLVCHPLVNTCSLRISCETVATYVKNNGNPVQYLDFNAEPEAKEEQNKSGGGNQKKKGGGKKSKAVLERKNNTTREDNLGIEYKKDDNFSKWYRQVIVKSEMIEYYPDVAGCYIFRPWSFNIWEHITAFFDGEIKKLGVQNAMFPLFVSKRALQAESDFIEGFAPEVAWVTRAGKTDLAEPIAIRPTSETIMYPAYSKWIRSHRDLPLKLNQWTSVVRWEFSAVTPFIRTREFLWQEGHSAFATFEEAAEEVQDILNLYARVYQELLAVPVIKGTKTEKEKFAGGHYTTTVEAFIPNVGRGVQGATSHCLGQNFAKAFHIDFEGKDGKNHHVWQNSWGLTTRSIGVMVMLHGDDKGLVLPPRVAPVQVVIVPVVMKNTQREALNAQAFELAAELKKAGLRVKVDDDDVHNPGFKFNTWEVRGVPIRLELGPRDLKNKVVVASMRNRWSPDADVRRKNKITLSWEGLAQSVQKHLDIMQAEMLEKATAVRDSHVAKVSTWSEFMDALGGKNMVLAPWCGVKECEVAIKAKSEEESKLDLEEEQENASDMEKLTGAAKSLCIPQEQPDLEKGTQCVHCEQEATKWCLFGRSY